MAQHDYIVENAPGQPTRTDINNALAAIVTLNAGDTEPTTTFSGMLWLNTNAGVDYPNGRLMMRNKANSGWIDPQTPAAGAAYSTGTFTPRIDGITTAGVATPSGTPSGVWTRIGRLITFQATISWTGHTGTGNMKMVLPGLPAAAVGIASAICNVSAANLSFAGQLIGYIAPNTNEVILATLATGAAVAGLPMDTSASLTVSGSYMTA